MDFALDSFRFGQVDELPYRHHFMRFDATDEADLFRQDLCFDHEVTGCYFRQFGDSMQFPFDFKYLSALLFITPQLTTILIFRCKFRRHGINFSN
jgi:hypothetical protein